MLGNFARFLVVFLFFSELRFFKKSFRNTNHSVKGFGSRSGPIFVGPDLGPYCLQDHKSDLVNKEKHK